jgi:glycosyltransferase involved in cell wall biosynthesis
MSSVSVIIAAFNASATLAATLDSVLAQTRVPNQIMVVDDGSTDGTADLARSYQGVEVQSRPNGGPAAAWNFGLATTSGEIVTFIDADDLWTSTTIADHLAVLAEPQIAASVGQVDEFVSEELVQADAARLRPRGRYAGWLAGATALRRSLLTETGPFNEDLRIGAWIDWVDRSRLSGGMFHVHPGLSLRRRLRHGTLGGASGRRDADLIDVARRALQRRRGDGK